jgi:hypothetical protein
VGSSRWRPDRHLVAAATCPLTSTITTRRDATRTASSRHTGPCSNTQSSAHTVSSPLNRVATTHNARHQRATDSQCLFASVPKSVGSHREIRRFFGRILRRRRFAKRKSASRPTSIFLVNPSAFSTSLIERVGCCWLWRRCFGASQDNRRDRTSTGILDQEPTFPERGPACFAHASADQPCSNRRP